MGTTQHRKTFLGLSPDGLHGGPYPGMPWEQYRGLPRMNPSTIVYGMESRRHLLHAATCGGIEPSNDMRLGTGIHAMTLEPHTFADTFVIIPAFHLYPENVTKEGKISTSTATDYCKQKTADFLRNEADGRQILSAEQYDRALSAVQAIKQCLRAEELVRISEPEVTMLGEIEGVRFKGRIDLLAEAVIGDIKTTVSCNPWKFSRQFRDLRYCHKLAIYRELVRQHTGKLLPVEIIAQEKRPPFDTVVFPVPDDKLTAAMTEVIATIQDYRLAIETDHWPGRDRGNLTVDLMDCAFGAPTKNDADEGFDFDSDETATADDIADGGLL